MSRRNALGQLIKQKRKELALTQRELAKKLGVEASHVAYLEGGKRNPSLALMGRLEQALGISRGAAYRFGRSGRRLPVQLFCFLQIAAIVGDLGPEIERS